MWCLDIWSWNQIKNLLGFPITNKIMVSKTSRSISHGCLGSHSCDKFFPIWDLFSVLSNKKFIFCYPELLYIWRWKLASQISSHQKQFLTLNFSSHGIWNMLCDWCYFFNSLFVINGVPEINAVQVMVLTYYYYFLAWILTMH